ncbi:MAG TPA: hypothetical protein VD905_13885 [Flavobacteriales bacterium]|nr:hypothetical protein [Flavobacteriales bacterium]
MVPFKLFFSTSFVAVTASAIAGAGGITPKKISQTMAFPVNPGSTTLTDAQMRFADSMFNVIVPGEALYFTLLDKSEEGLEDTKRSEITFKRAEALLQYCRDRKYSPLEYYAEITPTLAPRKVRTIDLSLSSFKFYAHGRSLTGMIFCPLEHVATSATTVNFNAGVAADEQVFKFNPADPIDVSLTSGTKITIPASSLMYPDGKPVLDPVDVKVAEYLEMDAIVMKMMTTTSGGKHLQTGGMWHIDVSCKGQPVVMKPGHDYHIQVANNNTVKDMKVFTGVMKNGLLDWQLQKDDEVIAGNVDVNGTINAAIPDVKNTVDKRQLQINGNINVNTDNLNRNVTVNESWNNNANFDPEAVRKYAEMRQRREQAVYDLKLNDFGWINCDAFDPSTQIMVDVLVRGDVSEKTTAMLVYPKRRSVLPGYVCEDKTSIKFTSVAADETAMLVVFTETEDKGMVMKYAHMITPGKNKSVDVKASKGTMADLQKEIKTGMADI